MTTFSTNLSQITSAALADRQADLRAALRQTLAQVNALVRDIQTPACSPDDLLAFQRRARRARHRIQTLA
ncbi:hypothetical protein SE16_00305, partial [Ardenticatena maritima]